jgi:hypothetical protein
MSKSVEFNVGGNRAPLFRHLMVMVLYLFSMVYARTDLVLLFSSNYVVI